jgi:surfeit locus 1 family protein
MFSPKPWILPGAMLSLVAGFASLGRWQLDRAEVNRAIEEGFVSAADQPLLNRPPADVAVDANRYRYIRLEGHFEGESQVLLDNMTRDGRVGYEVLTPFAVDGADRPVIVNRGWVESSLNRDELPDVTIADTAGTILGRIDRLPRAALRLGDSEVNAGRAVTVLSFPDFAELETALDRPLFHFQVLLDPAADHGFLRDWGPETGRADRNIAYAVQWFGLSLLALAIAVGIVVRRSRAQHPVPP